MSQRKEKYARSLGRRMDKLEDRTGRLEKSRDRIGKRLGEYSSNLLRFETMTSERDVRKWYQYKEIEERLREIERGVVVALLLEVLLAAVILIVAVNV